MSNRFTEGQKKSENPFLRDSVKEAQKEGPTRKALEKLIDQFDGMTAEVIEGLEGQTGEIMCSALLTAGFPPVVIIQHLLNEIFRFKNKEQREGPKKLSPFILEVFQCPQYKVMRQIMRERGEEELREALYESGFFEEEIDAFLFFIWSEIVDPPEPQVFRNRESTIKAIAEHFSNLEAAGSIPIKRVPERYKEFMGKMPARPGSSSGNPVKDNIRTLKMVDTPLDVLLAVVSDNYKDGIGDKSCVIEDIIDVLIEMGSPLAVYIEYIIFALLSCMSLEEIKALAKKSDQFRRRISASDGEEEQRIDQIIEVYCSNYREGRV